MPRAVETAGRTLPAVSRISMLASPFAAFLPFDFDPVEHLPPVLEAHLPGLGEHSLLSARAIGFLARRLGLPAPKEDALRLGALYHDTGKLLVPAPLLAAPRALTPEELAIVRRHVILALRLLGNIPLPL